MCLGTGQGEGASLGPHTRASAGPHARSCVGLFPGLREQRSGMGPMDADRVPVSGSPDGARVKRGERRVPEGPRSSVSFPAGLPGARVRARRSPG